jgi:hypothetical protein
MDTGKRRYPLRGNPESTQHVAHYRKVWRLRAYRPRALQFVNVKEPAQHTP